MSVIRKKDNNFIAVIASVVRIVRFETIHLVSETNLLKNQKRDGIKRITFKSTELRRIDSFDSLCNDFKQKFTTKPIK